VGLVKWVRAVLTQHTALLMAQPELVKSLTPLYQVYCLFVYLLFISYIFIYLKLLLYIPYHNTGD